MREWIKKRPVSIGWGRRARTSEFVLHFRCPFDNFDKVFARDDAFRDEAVHQAFSEQQRCLTMRLFAANIRNSTRLVPGLAPDRVRLVNVASPTRIRGSEVLLRYRVRQFTLTGSYVFVDATEADDAATNRVRVPLTPKHTAGLVGMWEDHDKGRIGVEVYYTGRQRLEDNPYRANSRPFFQIGLLGEAVVNRHLKAFVNAENLLGIRQTRYDPLVLPARLPDGRWTVDVWAPTDGFILNGGIRLSIGGAH